MKIINLIEDTIGRDECVAAHGLSFYVETKKHKLLLDLGPSSQTIENAKALGIDLKEINSKNMESKITKDLYFCGEIIDVDGVCCGGYNLQWAWSSGLTAGELGGKAKC